MNSDKEHEKYLADALVGLDVIDKLLLEGFASDAGTTGKTGSTGRPEFSSENTSSPELDVSQRSRGLHPERIRDIREVENLVIRRYINLAKHQDLREDTSI